MSEAVRWLLVAELLGLVGLPLTIWLLGSLPDRGFPFSKTVGAVSVTWLVWLGGSLFSLGDNVPVAAALLAVAGVTAWLVLGTQTLTFVRDHWKVLLTEELLFITAFVVWTFVRSLHPDIAGTEKPMDLMLLQTSGASASFPPRDLWLAGHTVNYYYFGYVVVALMEHLAGVSPFVAFNLAQSLIFAAAISGTYSIGYALTRSRIWSGLAPMFVVLMGNLHAFLFQILHGQFPWNQGNWFWDSSRVITGTINEFPMFTFVLGDLHPHLLALPMALLCVALGLAVYFDRAFDPGGPRPVRWKLAAGGLFLGSLLVTNTWDYPTYLILVLGLLWLGTFRSRSGDGSGRDLLPSVLLDSGIVVGASIVAFLPYDLSYRSPTGGFGWVHSFSNLGQFGQIFGFAGVILATLAGLTLTGVKPARAVVAGIRRPATQLGQATVVPGNLAALGAGALVLAVGLAAYFHLWVLLLAACLAGVSGWLALRKEAGPVESAVLLMTALAALIVGFTEVVYIRDAFAGSVDYRMNTVFKFYFQIWIIAGVAGSFAVYRVTQRLWNAWRPIATGWVAGVTLVTLAACSYTVLGPLSYYATFSTASLSSVSAQPHSLAGLASFAADDPQDFQAISWFRRHVSGRPIVLEATGGEYSYFARVSTFSGLPTLLGWEGHEEQWRPGDPVLERRRQTINTIYSTGTVRLARRLLVANHVSYVYVGPCEQQVYASTAPSGICGSSSPVASAPNALRKFRDFMNVAYDRDGVMIYRMR